MKNKVRVLSRLALLAVFLGATGAQAKTVLITGSNQGIGLEFAKQYAADGWTVVATHRRDEEPETLVELRSQYPDLVRIERMDVSSNEEIEALAEKMRGEPIDILLNNASLIRFDPIQDPNGNMDQKFGTLDYEGFDQFMHTNVAGPLMVAEAFAQNVIDSEEKKMVTISSAAGAVSILPRGSDHYWYRISKAALNSAMRLVTVEMQEEGVTVVMFHPGGVQVESFGDFEMPGMMTPTEAVTRLRTTIAGLTFADSGRFLQGDGTDHPW